MNKAYTFRKGNFSDLGQIRDLTILAYMQYQNVIAIENVEAWKKGRENENTFIELLKIAHCFVCEYEDGIVGSAFLIPHGNPYNWFESEWAYIRLLAVHPDFEGNGIGRRLTQMCIDTAKETGETIVALHTSEFQDAARHIYENLGFVKRRDLDLIYGKQYYLYTLELSQQ
ncbi:MAG: GNAT family N-acetyltransferase [Flavobacteriales bacterium]